MSKAILVLNEMPNRCNECILYSCSEHRKCHGQFMGLIERYEELDDYKQNNCPLFPMPEKSNVASDWDEYEDGWDDGWNSCVKYLENQGVQEELDGDDDDEMVD